MGFWSSLVSDVTDGIHWVANNAGTIATVAGTVAKVAAFIPLTEEEERAQESILLDEDHNLLPKLNLNMPRAINVLKQNADSLFKQPDVGDGQRLLGPFTRSGIWPASPTTANQTSVPPAIVVDINKFLSLNGQLTTYKGKDGEDTDIGHTLANQLFAHKTNQNASSNDDKDANPLLNNSVTIDIGQLSFSGGNVWYEVPVGNPGTDVAIHSYIKLYILAPSAALNELRAMQKALSVEPARSLADAGGSYNSTTLAVDFNGARNTETIMKKALSTMQSPKSPYKLIQGAINTGATYNYQFRTEPSVGPSEVWGALSAAISGALPKPQGGADFPRMPQVKITNMKTYIS